MSEHLPGRCHIGDEGRLRGPANITYNDPWPTPNCTPGGFGTAFGGVVHTEVGFEHSVVEEFNNPGSSASAFFSISMTGAIHQYMPLGKDFAAWTQAAGNAHYRGVEHEDHGNPANPLTDAQLNASAQVFEAMSAFDGWPLEATDNPDGGRGIIFHVDGGQAWGGHECPGPVRMRQRAELIRRARAIRAGKSPVTTTVHITTGSESWAELAGRHGIHSAHLLRLNGGPDKPFTEDIAAYVNIGNLNAPMPPKVKVRVPVP